MKKILIATTCFFFPLFFLTKDVEAQAKKYIKKPEELLKIEKLRRAVEATPQNLSAYNEFIYAFKVGDPELDRQYAIWEQKYHEVVELPLSIGQYYARLESSKGKDWLLKAAKIDSLRGDIWWLLSIDALRWGNDSVSREYLIKAIKADPDNSDYAFYYAASFEGISNSKHDSLLHQVVLKFPVTYAAARALVNLADNASNPLEKEEYYEQLYTSYSKQNAEPVENGMSRYFHYLLDQEPQRAYELSLRMLNDRKLPKWQWIDKEKVSKGFVSVQTMLRENNHTEAKKIVNEINLLSPFKAEHIDAEESLLLLKAAVEDANKNTKAAYDSLLLYYSKMPSDKLYAVMKGYAVKLHYDSAQICKGVWKVRDSLSKPATDFNLDNYLTGQKTSLADYKGKVVLLTYWFPGCGPCRREFPFLESALKKHSEEVAYLGINLENKQDDYVIPFMKSTGYSFVPLRNDPLHDKGTLKARAAPANYIIDQKGQIMFSGFLIDEKNQRSLEIMIHEVLSRNKKM